MTDESSVPGPSHRTSVGRTDTYHVDARNRVETQDRAGTLDRVETLEGGGTDRPERPRFDFRFTRSDRTPTAVGTALGLLAGGLGATSYAVTGPLARPPDVERITVDGHATVAEPTAEEAAVASALVSAHATLHVETDAPSASLDRWRRLVRDHAATQTALPTGASLSVAVARVP